MAASRELAKKLAEAQAAAGDTEAEVGLLLANAWLAAVSPKLTDEDAKASAAAAQEALANYLKLRPQLMELEQGIATEATAVRDGLRKITMELVRQRAKREPGPHPEGERPKPPDF